MIDFKWTPKQDAFLKSNNAKVEFLEGTTASGKTTVGAYKFMCRVMASPQQMHILSAEDTGTAEKNIIHKENGLEDLFKGTFFYYRGNGNAQIGRAHV